ncbi:MAG: MFS transporter [Cytophagales bacterium]|nr:MFS transporter [Cytophagales bacterium]
MNPELARLIIGHVFLHSCMAGMRLAAPLWALHAGYSPLTVGVLLAAFALTQVFLALPAGRFAEAYGLKRPVRWSIAASTSGALLAAAYPHILTLSLAALLIGGATGSTVIALQRHVGRTVMGQTELKQVFSWLSLGPAFSNFLGPVTAGFLIDHAGFQMTFFVMAFFPITMWLWMRHTQEPVISAASKNAAKNNVWDLVREPMLRRVLMVNWFLSACWDVHAFVVPILGHDRGYSASTIGFILGAFAVSATVVRSVLPFFAQHMTEWKVVMTAMLIASAIFGVYPLLPNPWVMGLFSIVLGFALGSVQPMIMSALHRITPDARQGEAIALRLMVINASSVAMPMLFGAGGAAFGVTLVFWAVSAWVGLGSRLAYGMRHIPDENRDADMRIKS